MLFQQIEFMNYPSSNDFYERLQEHAIDMTGNFNGRNYEMFVIHSENKNKFPELKYSFANAGYLFHVNNIRGIGLLSKNFIIEYICLDNELNNTGEIVCRSILLENWIEKMAVNDEERLKKLMAALPYDYRNKFSVIIDGIERKTRVSESPESLVQTPIIT